LVWDEAPLTNGAALVSYVRQMSIVERCEMVNGEIEALACGRRVENILALMLTVWRG
jgi:hypothetical protein